MAYPYFNNLAPGPDPYPLSKKEECMNHGRGERTDHLPIFYKTMPERISRLTGTKAISINLRSLRRGFLRE
jgi:hypothetical protein